MQLGLYKSIVITALMAMFVCNSHAEIYTCKDAKGNTVFTDTPSACANSEKIKTDKLPTLVPSKSFVTRSNTNAKKAEDKNSYTELVITSPANDATIRDNQGSLTINFRVAPGLNTRKGHKYVVSVNGKEVYSGTSTITALKNVDRGTQTIAVKVVDADDNAMISATPVKVTLQRFSALQNAGSSNDNAGSNNDAGQNTGQNTTNQRFPSLPKLNNRVSPSTN